MSEKNGHIDCSAEELTALAMLAGRSRFPGVSGAPFAGLAEGERDAVLRGARRALAARGLVSIDDDGLVSVSAPYEDMMRVALAPGVFVSAQRQTRQGGEIRLFLARPELGVEHRSPVPGIDRLTSFDPSELLELVTKFVGVKARPSADGPAITTTIGELNHVRGGDSAKGSALGAIGASFVGSATVRCLHGRGRILGGEYAWVDAGDQGLWQLNLRLLDQPEAPAESTEAVLTPTTAGSIVGELLRFLPAVA